MGKLLHDFYETGMNPKPKPIKLQLGGLKSIGSGYSTVGVATENMIGSFAIGVATDIGRWRSGKVDLDFHYQRKPEQTLIQKAIQLQNNVDVMCEIIELVDKIEKEI